MDDHANGCPAFFTRRRAAAWKPALPSCANPVSGGSPTAETE